MLKIRPTFASVLLMENSVLCVIINRIRLQNSKKLRKEIFINENPELDNASSGFSHLWSSGLKNVISPFTKTSVVKMKVKVFNHVEVFGCEVALPIALKGINQMSCADLSVSTGDKKAMGCP